MIPVSDPLSPTPAECLTRALGDLRMGLPCTVEFSAEYGGEYGGERSGAQRAVIVAVEPLTQPRLDALCTRFGAPVLVLTAHRARAVLPAPAAVHGTMCIRPPAGADLDWYRMLADPVMDHTAPVRGPLHLLHGGQTVLHSAALDLVKAAELLPAALLFEGADLPGTARIDTACTHIAHQADPVASALFPIEAASEGRLHVFRNPTGSAEHYAFEIGTPDRTQPVLARLHSACFTGDVLGSLKCDCGPQLHGALAQMGDAGAGVLLYLNQEGRGIGLANKMRVYGLQARGLDTVEANHRLGFADDERDFRVAAGMLRSLGFHAARLLTNNPAKAQVFRDEGITITETLPLRVGRNAHNSAYLATKARKSGHAL
jgi:GTP cyclohydrolase II